MVELPEPDGTTREKTMKLIYNKRGRFSNKAPLQLKNLFILIAFSSSTNSFQKFAFFLEILRLLVKL